MKNILFVCWDGPQSNYMQGLFMPIFSEIQNKSNYTFHIIQFTWGTSEKIAITQKVAQELHLVYTARVISRKPIAVLGSLITLYKGIRFLNNYIKMNDIAIVMPRSTMPAIMVNRIAKQNFKIVFDADGLPLEERVDFSGLRKSSMQYQVLKREEDKILNKADLVLTRSEKAIQIHSKTIKALNTDKFSVVLNGRAIDFFKPNVNIGVQKRTDLGINQNAKVFVYCGSLGPQYGWEEMIAIFRKYQEKNLNALFLILTENVAFTHGRIPNELKDSILIKTVPYEIVPNYLSIADIAFAIREPQFSMQGVAPIKLGEYLLMGIPTIASLGIGDTEKILNAVPNCFLYDHQSSCRVEEAVTFIEGLGNANYEEIRKYALPFYSIANSADSYCNVLNKLK